MANAELLEQTHTLEVSPTQELTISAPFLKGLGFKPGQKFVAIAFQGSIQLIPVVTHEEARGSMPGVDILVERMEGKEQE